MIGFSKFGRVREVVSETATIEDGLKIYHLTLACGHSLHIRASVYSAKTARRRRCPECRAGEMPEPLLIQASKAVASVRDDLINSVPRHILDELEDIVKTLIRIENDL